MSDRGKRIFGGHPVECDCDKLLLNLIGETRHDERARFVVVREYHLDGKTGVLLFGHNLNAKWLKGPVQEILEVEAKDCAEKEALR